MSLYCDTARVNGVNAPLSFIFNVIMKNNYEGASWTPSLASMKWNTLTAFVGQLITSIDDRIHSQPLSVS